MKLIQSNIAKKFFVLSMAVAGLAGTTRTYADDIAPVADVAVYQPMSQDNLQQLTAPIALYPDALLAQVLAASTYPNDVASAAQYLQNGGDPNAAGNFGWDASVQGLLQTQDVLNFLAANGDWMNQLGDSFLNQQQDVFTAIQTLRGQAMANGNLVSNDQTQVLVTDAGIEIVPANPQMIYVPQYDPAVVYVTPSVNFTGPCITFDGGVRVGLWLHEDLDWSDHRVYSGNWGGDRPWWHNDRGSDRVDYGRNRPGVYVNQVTNVTNIRNTNTTTVKNATVWNHDSNKPAPRHNEGPAITRSLRPTSVSTNGPARHLETPAVHSPVSTMVRTPTKTVNSNVRPAVQPMRNETTTPPSVRPVPTGLLPKPGVTKAPVQPVHSVQPVVHTNPAPTIPSHPVTPLRTANVATHPAQPNPVRQPVSQPVATHAPKAVATTTPRTTSTPVARTTSTPAARNTQPAVRTAPAASRPASTPLVNRATGNPNAKMQHR